MTIDVDKHAETIKKAIEQAGANEEGEREAAATAAEEAEEADRGAKTTEGAEITEDAEVVLAEGEGSAITERDPPETSVDPPRSRTVRRVASPQSASAMIRYAALALAALATLSALWFGYSWYGAANDPDRAFSTQRDDALRSAGQAIINLNTLDYRDIDAGLRLWQDSATAELYSEIVSGTDRLKTEIGKAKTVTTARILDAALTELDLHAGKARVIAVLEVTVQPPEGDPTIKQTRLVGELTTTPEGWKLSALGQAPAGRSQGAGDE